MWCKYCVFTRERSGRFAAASDAHESITTAVTKRCDATYGACATTVAVSAFVWIRWSASCTRTNCVTTVVTFVICSYSTDTVDFSPFTVHKKIETATPNTRDASGRRQTLGTRRWTTNVRLTLTLQGSRASTTIGKKTGSKYMHANVMATYIENGLFLQVVHVLLWDSGALH